MANSSRTEALLQLIRFDKPIGTLLLLWPTLWALWIAAQGTPDYDLLFIFVVGTFLTRSAGCIINDFADRHIDGAVARTQSRPLVTGAVTERQAKALFVVLMLVAFVLVLFTNTLTILLSFGAVLLASCYPFMKRYTQLPQLVLGAAFSWGIPMAFAAQGGTLPPALWLLYLGNLLWTMAYDTKYAMVDREDDLKIGIKSSAILFGRHDRLIIAGLQLACLWCLYQAGQVFGLGTYYNVSLTIAAALFCYQLHLIRHRDPAACFKAFLHNNWVGMVIFAGIVLDYLAGAPEPTMEFTAAGEAFTVQFLSSLDQISPGQWNDIAELDYPFGRHEFLYGLEKTGCTTAETGWQPCHAILRKGDAICAVMPLYLKSHSYGEYVFDWSWADAWRQSGLDYYPKLVSAIPFTPATGPRLCVAAGYDPGQCLDIVLQAIKDLATKRGISSWHLLFPTEDVSEKLLAADMHRRGATQFHWFNEGYTCFDDFLETFNSRKRKSLKRERRRVADQGLTLKTLTGAEIGAQEWQLFYHFYQMTYAKRSGHGGYLNQGFFLETAAGMGEQVVMVLAYLDNRAVAGALYFRSSDTLYGRYWGCEREFDCLHFEACYYQGIEYCIANKLARFDPGAQGEHKIQRGFRPVTTWSNHWIADPRLSAAVGDFTRREEHHNEDYRQATTRLLPFK